MGEEQKAPEFTMGEEWIAHEGTGWELVPKAEAPPAPPSRGTMTVTGLDATAITFDSTPTRVTLGSVDAELAPRWRGMLRPPPTPRNRHERRAEAARARRAGEPCQVMPEHGLACVLGAALLEARGGRGR